MPCPLFIPSQPLGDLVSGAPPLGDLFAGTCAADTSAPIEADRLRRHCNFGYARGQCERAAQSDVDAVRFLVKANRGDVIQIGWSTERNHHPVAVGVLEIDSHAAIPADILSRQAFACASAYIRQSYTGEPKVHHARYAAHP